MTSIGSAPRVAYAIATFAVVPAITGCGGGSDETYSFRLTVSCLVQADANVSEDEDDLYAPAANAGVGGFMVDFGRNTAQVAVERNADDAERAAESYEAGEELFGGDTDGLVARHGNVVVVWDKTPTDTERSTVEDCLTG